MDVYKPHPIATGWLDQDRRSELLTYIWLRDAAKQGFGHEPRWVFARFHLNGPATLADTMPVHTPGSGSDGGDRFTISCHLLQLLGVRPPYSLGAISLQAAVTDSAGW